MGQILIGMKQIRGVLNNTSEPTILKWHQQYEGFPMKKMNGQWTSEKEVLVSWFRHYLTDSLDQWDKL